MRILGIAALCAALGGCSAVNVREATLSTNQKVAIVSSPGDGVSPPSSTILMAGRNGQFVPVSSGFAQAPVTAALSGAAAGIAIGGGTYAAAKALRPTQVNQVQSGGTITGATSSSQGASASASGGTGGTNIGGSNTAFGGSGGFGSGGSATASGGTALGGSGGTAFGGSGGSAFGGSATGGTAIGGTGIGGTAISN